MPRLAYLSGAPRLSTRPQAEPSGPRGHVLGVIRGFEQAGWEVKRYILGDELPGWVSGPGSEEAFGGRGVRTLAADALRLLARVTTSGRAIARTGSDIDWAYERFSPFQAIGRAYRRRGVPWILETNGVLFPDVIHKRHNLVMWRAARRMELEAYRECDVLVCVSQALRDAVTRTLPIPASKVIVSGIAVDPVFFDPGPTAARRLFSEFTIGFIGRLYIWTGLELLLRAVAELNAEDLTCPRVVIVGEGEAGKSLRELTWELGLEDKVRFTGQVPMAQAPAYIKGFDIGYVAPEAVEGLGMYFSPMKLAEYLAMEKPALAAAHPGMLSMVDDETGFLFEPKNVQSLKAAIQRAASKAGRLEEMGRWGRQLILSRHTWAIRVRELIRDIGDVLGTEFGHAG